MTLTKSVKKADRPEMKAKTDALVEAATVSINQQPVLSVNVAYYQRYLDNIISRRKKSAN